MPPSATAATPIPRTQPITLRFMSARGDAMGRFTQLWSDYGSRDKVSFEVERAASLQDLNTKLTAMYAGDSAPDVNDCRCPASGASRAPPGPPGTRSPPGRRPSTPKMPGDS